MYLLKRGIPSEVVKQTLHIDISDELKNARRLADRKMKALKSYSLTTAKRRLYGLLARRGYSQEVIMHVLNDKQNKEDET
jgi:regulatory protein